MLSSEITVPKDHGPEELKPINFFDRAAFLKYLETNRIQETTQPSNREGPDKP